MSHNLKSPDKYLIVISLCVLCVLPGDLAVKYLINPNFWYNLSYAGEYCNIGFSTHRKGRKGRRKVRYNFNIFLRYLCYISGYF